MLGRGFTRNYADSIDPRSSVFIRARFLDQAPCLGGTKNDEILGRGFAPIHANFLLYPREPAFIRVLFSYQVSRLGRACTPGPLYPHLTVTPLDFYNAQHSAARCSYQWLPIHQPFFTRQT